MEAFERDRLRHYVRRSCEEFRSWTCAVVGMVFWVGSWAVLAAFWLFGDVNPALFLSLSIPLLLGAAYYHFQQRARGHQYLSHESQLRVFVAKLSVKYKKPAERLLEE